MFRWFSIFSSVKRSKKDIQLIRFIIKTFGYRPKELSYFYEALTHKSISNKSEKLNSNERLEFLGDAIFDAVIANYLYDKFPEEDEGYLTKLKSKIVSRKSLSSIADKIQLRKHILYQKGRSIKIATLEGNAFEALMGAIYLDGGYQAVHKTVNHHVFRKYVNVDTLLEEEIDFKSKLFIWMQKNKLNLEFKVISEENNGEQWIYKVEAEINGQSYGMGVGASKKIAEQAAAKETLILMGEL
ncbi:MAG: ribonuclease III [Lishizhenia sp.]